MERLDSAAAGLIEQEVRGHFPEDMVDSVAVLQYGDDPAVEPGQVVVEVTIAAGPEGARIRWRPSTETTGMRSGSSSGISASGGHRPPGSRWSPARATAASSYGGRPRRTSHQGVTSPR